MRPRCRQSWRRRRPGPVGAAGQTMTEPTVQERSPITVVIGDDHPLMRDGLRALIASLPDIEIVAEAADGESARRETQLTHPDVVVMDLRMPGTNGVDATRAILRSVPETRVL